MAAGAALSKTQIYVSNLPPEVPDQRLRAAFARFGDITDAFVPVRGKRLRFGFVAFECAESVEPALGMDGEYLDEEHRAMRGDEGIGPLKVVVASEKPLKPLKQKAAPVVVYKDWRLLAPENQPLPRISRDDPPALRSRRLSEELSSASTPEELLTALAAAWNSSRYADHDNAVNALHGLAQLSPDAGA